MRSKRFTLVGSRMARVDNMPTSEVIARVSIRQLRQIARGTYAVKLEPWAQKHALGLLAYRQQGKKVDRNLKM